MAFFFGVGSLRNRVSRREWVGVQRTEKGEHLVGNGEAGCWSENRAGICRPVSAPDHSELQNAIFATQNLASSLVHPSTAGGVLDITPGFWGCSVAEFRIVVSGAVFKFPGVCRDVMAGYRDVECAVDKERYVVR